MRAALSVPEGSLRVIKSPAAADGKPAQLWPCGRIVIVVCGRVPRKVPGSVPAEFRSCSGGLVFSRFRPLEETAAQLSSGL